MSATIQGYAAFASGPITFFNSATGTQTCVPLTDISASGGTLTYSNQSMPGLQNWIQYLIAVGAIIAAPASTSSTSSSSGGLSSASAAGTSSSFSSLGASSSSSLSGGLSSTGSSGASSSSGASL